MYWNYLKTALRNMKNHKLYTVINVSGLSLGITVCILIFLLVRDEFSYDTWIKDIDDLYRIEGARKTAEGTFDFQAVSPGRMYRSLAETYVHEFDAITRIYNENTLVRPQGLADEQRGLERGVISETISYVDPSFFDVFDFDMISGSAVDIFRDNLSVAISETVAKKYFGDVNPVGNFIQLEEKDLSFKIVGVVADPPEKTHLDVNIIALFDPGRYSQQPWIERYWLISNVYTYVKLAEGVNPSHLTESFPAYLDTNIIPSETLGLNQSPSEAFNLRLMPVGDIHLYSNGTFQMKPGGNILVVYSFTGIALLIIIIAAINFVNLSTARSFQRAREVAIRKAVGARQSQLIQQFLGEAFVTVSISILIALAMVEVLLPWFNNFVGKILLLDFNDNPTNLFALFGFVLVLGLGASIYPAIHITRFRPANVLRSGRAKGASNSVFRNVLVTIQFAISIGLIVTTLVVHNQIQYANKKDLGFENSGRVLLKNITAKNSSNMSATLVSEIQRLPGVENVSFSGRAIPLKGFWDIPFTKLGAQDGISYKLERVPVGSGFLELYSAKLLAGRFLGDQHQADGRRRLTDDNNVVAQNIVISREAVKHLNLDGIEEAVGRTIRYKLTDPDTIYQITVVGVVEDMHLRSLRSKLQPMVYTLEEKNMSFLSIKLGPDAGKQTVKDIEQVWKKHVPEFDVSLSFVDQDFQKLYASDRLNAEVFSYFSIFAIFVSSLGLFGLSSFSAESKTKEIGVRKVYGASTSSIITLLIWQFSKPVLIANIIAWPIAGYFMHDWLTSFAYRIDFSVLPFFFATTITLIIAWGTVSFHAWRVSQTNPVNAFKYD
jgi:putative ABC transport system permease protein